jgi:acyl-CoA thioester hydrolase
MENKFEIEFKTRWSDFDPNRHMRHTAYNDYAAEVRVRFFETHDFHLNDFSRHNIGPILFKEETTFLKEIHIGENIKVDMELISASPGLERWVFRHRIYNQKGQIAAEIKASGAWIDLQKRKLTHLPDEIWSILKTLPKSDDFIEIKLNKKS